VDPYSIEMNIGGIAMVYVGIDIAKDKHDFDKVAQRAKLKQSVSRLVNILFPELEKLVSTLHGYAVYELLSEFPSAKHIASANLKHLTHLLDKASKSRFKRVTADEIRETAKRSSSSYPPAKSLELRHTIKLIRELNCEIREIEAEIKKIMDVIGSPILGVPGIGQNIGAMKSAISLVSAALTRYLLLLVVLRLHTNQDSFIPLMQRWKNVVQGIFAGRS
jgi:hypothetical protein